MNTSNLVKLLERIGLEKIKVVNGAEDTNIMFCCSWHGEQNPSAGISVNKLIGGCFACNQGFTLISLVMHELSCSFKKACDLIDDYGGNTRGEEISSRKILRYGEAEETAEKMPVLPNHKLAIYGSGKKFHKYILERFPKDICRKFMIGWDEESLRITIPIFNREDGLLGFIRRAVLNPKVNGETNPEYEKVYGNQPKYLIDSYIVKSHVLYPINHFILPQDRTVLIVEGQIDCMRMHQHGFTNTLSIINSKINQPQIDALKMMGVQNIINFLDPDEAGRTGGEKLQKLCRKDFNIYNVKWPDGVSDPDGLTKEQTEHMIVNKIMYQIGKLKRI